MMGYEGPPNKIKSKNGPWVNKGLEQLALNHLTHQIISYWLVLSHCLNFCGFCELFLTPC